MELIKKYKFIWDTSILVNKVRHFSQVIFYRKLFLSIQYLSPFLAKFCSKRSHKKLNLDEDKVALVL